MNKAKRPTDNTLKLFFTLLLSTIILGANAQVYSEDFGVASSCSSIDTVPDNTAVTLSDWRVYLGGNNSLDTTNRWFISSRESNQGLGNCSDGCSGGGSSNQTLHISTNSGTVDPNAIYEHDSVADIWAYTPVFNATNFNGDYRVEFDYLHVGDTADSATFVVTIGTGSFLTPTYGTYTLERTNTSSCPNGEWAHYVLYLNTSINTQTQVFFGFHWVNDGNGSGGNRSFAVDNLEVYETNPLTIIGASDTVICDGGTVDFTDESEGNATAWNWSFGSAQTPTTSTSQNVSGVLFPTPGTYVVTLTTTNANGNHDSTITIQVDNCFPPTPQFVASDYDLCQGQCINYFETSIPGTYGNAAQQYIWQFQGGNPNVSFDQNPQNICYAVSGTYDVTLTIVDTVSGEDSTIIFDDTIKVGTCQVPVAAFITDTLTICNNDFIEFYSISTGNPDSIRWEFGDSANPSIITWATDSVDTLQVYFPTPGTYTVTMTVWNGAGLDDTIGVFQVINVLDCPVPTALFTVSRRILCPGDVVVFEDLSLHATEWEWEFPGGLPSVSVEQHPEVRYDSAGYYPVNLIVKNVNGLDTLLEVDYIYVDSCPLPRPSFEVESDSICRGSCVQFFNTSVHADSIFWIFWWHPYKDSVGDTVITYHTFNDTIDTTRYIVSENFIPMFIKPDSTIDTLFMAQDPIFCFNDSGVVGVQLFAYNEYGIGIENSQDIAILNVGGAHPELKPGPDKYAIEDNIESRFYLDDTIKFEPEGTAPHYRWFPEEGLSCYDCQNPIIYPTETKKYFVTNYDDYGCQAYDSVIVFVENSYFAGIPNLFSPNGDDNNDILWVRGNGIESEGFVFRIWNRYGEVVFETFTQNEGWDGNYKGAPAPVGSYTYYVKLIFANGQTEELTGDVTIVRY